MESVKDEVAMWEEEVVIPTYPVGEPDHNPMFLERRVYQGSSGAVYPYPVIDSVSDHRVDKSYRAVFLENEYLKLMILPELGGRIHMAYAKALDYHFVYYNRVIKPALVGLAGPWICGGIEFNWPQHHRPSTFSAVDYLLEPGPDGGATVWVGEIDRMRRTKAAAGISLLPGSAYIRVEGRLFNGTDFPETFLWWANPAVPVNESYQSIFPADVRAVFDHGKRDVSQFPIATGTYYKVDYSAGVDISWWKNIPVPTSYMAYHSDFDFVGGYDHSKKAGILHVADHHISPGKKLWTWGNGDFGKAWERNLTDEDGPYIELMTGVFTDNQPDFSWLEPGEEKRFEQYFFPFAGIGGVKNASPEVAINLEIDQGVARVGVASTRKRTYRVEIVRGTPEVGGRSLMTETVDVDPGNPYLEQISMPAEIVPEEITLTVCSIDGKVRLSYREGERPGRPVPEPAKAAPRPQEVGTNEELYLIGLHLEQYRHATFDPASYYAEALKRDSFDSRANVAMGLCLLRRGLFAEAEPHFRRAIERVTQRNPNPANGEPFFFLGRALELQGRYVESAEAYFKAAWNGALKGAAFGSLGRIAARRGSYEEALSYTTRSLAVNGRDHQVRTMHSALLRRLGRTEEARIEAETVLRDDPLAWSARNELRLLGQRQAGQAKGAERERFGVGNLQATSLEAAFEYARWGLFEEALDQTKRLIASESEHPDARDPLAHYCRASLLVELGRDADALAEVRLADSLPSGTCFPNQLEAIGVLEQAGRLFPGGAKSFYYLGDLWYNNRCYPKAIAAWERSIELDPGFPTAHRNLALAAFNKLHDPARARRELEIAFSLDQSDARVFFELDQLYRSISMDPAERIARLDEHPALIERRDDLSIERITLLNLLGRYAEALGVISRRRFHPWEGGEGKVTRQYVVSLLGLAKEALLAGKPESAAELARRALHYPENLGEGKLEGTRDNDVHFYLARACRLAGKESEARESLELACVGDQEPAFSMYYNDQPADMIFYQGLALASTGRVEAARGSFRRLIDHGERHRNDEVKDDYFAVSLPDFLVFEGDLNRRNRVFCEYLVSLGSLGLAALDGGQAAKARALLETVVTEEPSHLGARELLRDLDRGFPFL